jgi:hypothetical protein
MPRPHYTWPSLCSSSPLGSRLHAAPQSPDVLASSDGVLTAQLTDLRARGQITSGLHSCGSVATFRRVGVSAGRRLAKLVSETAERSISSFIQVLYDDTV